MGEVARLRVVNFALGLDLTNCKEGVERADDNLALVTISLFDHAAEEVVVRFRHLMVENWSVVHVVLKQGDAFEL